MSNNFRNNTVSILTEESQALQAIINRSKKDLIHAPAGSVQIRKHGSGYQFYFHSGHGKKTDEESDENCNHDSSKSSHKHDGKFMRASEHKKAMALIQKKYLIHLIRAAAEQQKVINTFLKQYDPKLLQNVFFKESSARQQFLKHFLDPAALPDSLYAVAWEKVEYEQKPFHENAAFHFTEKNERVRSKSEVLIANSLYKAGIPYRYECPLQLGGNLFHPDFTVLRSSDRKELYWEHLGLMDDITYCRTTLQKIEIYESNGIFPGDQLILTSETARSPLNSVIVNRTINHYLL